MAEFSDYYEDKIIDHMLRGQAFSVPTTVYVALFTAVTGLEANTPSAEVSGNAYARQAVTLSAGSGGLSSNTGDLTFPTATPASWGTVTHCAIVDHVSNVTWGTNVNVLMWSQLDTSKLVDAGDTFKINTGDLDVAIA
jgi:hypothetical protein